MGNNETVDKTEWNTFPIPNPEQVIFSIIKRLWHQMFGDDRTVISQTEALKTCWDILEQYNSNNGQKQVAKVCQQSII